MNFILKNSKLIFLVFILVFISSLTYLKNFSLDASADSLVLENDSDLKFYEELRQRYPSNDSLIIAYQVKDNILDSKSLDGFKNFINDIENLADVKNTTSILNVPLFLSPKIAIGDLGSTEISINKGNADLALAQEEFKKSPIYSDNLVSLDGKTTAILVAISDNTDLAIKDIRSLINKYQKQATIFLGGLPMIRHDIIGYIANDLVFFSVAVIAIMALILLIIFKSIRFMFMPIFISLSTALFMSSLIGFLNWKITVISSNFFSLLLVLSLAVTIHLIVRYRELATKINDKNQLIEQTIRQMFKPCIYTTLTTLIAFISLLVSGIRPVIDFGFIMSIGVSLAFVFSFMLFILIMKILPKIKIKHQQREFAITTIFATITKRFGNLIIILSILLAIITAIGISKISVENKFIDYFKESTEINQGLSLIDDDLGGTVDLEIIFNDIGADYFNSQFLRDRVNQVHNYLDGRAEVGKVLSIDTLMQILATANNNLPPSGFFLNVIKNNISASAKTQIFDPYIDEEKAEIRVVARVKENYSGLNRNQLIKSINNDLIEMGFKEDSFRIGGTLVLYNNMLQSLFDSQIKTIGLVFLLIWLMFVLLFRSIKIATIAVIPNILPALGIIGFMGLLGISLDLMTITIASIAIGIGVDNAIHYTIRFRKEFSKTNDYTQSMFNAHKSIGLAMFYTAVTVIIGFLALTLSNFIPSIYFGIFTGIAMLLAILLNLTLLPKLLIMFKAS